MDPATQGQGVDRLGQQRSQEGQRSGFELPPAEAGREGRGDQERRQQPVDGRCHRRRPLAPTAQGLRVQRGLDRLSEQRELFAQIQAVAELEHGRLTRARRFELGRRQQPGGEAGLPRVGPRGAHARVDRLRPEQVEIARIRMPRLGEGGAVGLLRRRAGTAGIALPAPDRGPGPMRARPPRYQATPRSARWRRRITPSCRNSRTAKSAAGGSSHQAEITREPSAANATATPTANTASRAFPSRRPRASSARARFA